jgi:hypothetical protein
VEESESADYENHPAQKKGSDSGYIVAAEVITYKVVAKCTYKKNQGYMPVVGHFAKTRLIAGCYFREGNVALS